ncbi:hypothetical protein PG994_003007 [Apiospora phragmitis]|uniref:Uncharacterized protein n=1 Tax=Apiospora phragmitis TaxID=2905665 RepID=A0ABR1W6T3_9PEZI
MDAMGRKRHPQGRRVVLPAGRQRLLSGQGGGRRLHRGRRPQPTVRLPLRHDRPNRRLRLAHIVRHVHTDRQQPKPDAHIDRPYGLRQELSSSSALSGGAIAGIVVGAVCGMALVASIFALVWYRKKRARNNNAAAGGAYSSPGQPPSDMAQQQNWSEYYGGGGLQQHNVYHDAATKQQLSSPYGSPQENASEVGGVQRHEMPNGRAYHEME